MHGFAGQLDLRQLSGLRKVKGWGVVSIAMLIGCLNLAGFPFTSGYFSKDMILAESFFTPGMGLIGWILLLTAGLTAYYTFRVYFRVFEGPVEYHPGDELHDHDHADDHGGGEEHHHDAGEHGDHHHAGFHPHAPGWAINTVLAALAVLSIAAAGLYFVNKKEHGWVGSMVHDSSAHYVGTAAFLEQSLDHAAHAGGATGESAKHAHGTFLGYDPHKVMYYVSAVVGAIGIGIAFVLHLLGRKEARTARADKLLPALGPIPRWAQNKWYVDELYNFLIVRPLWVISHIFHLIDKLLVDGLVNLFGLLPRAGGSAIRPSQSGALHGYAVGMAGGVATLLLVVLILVTR